MKQSLPWLLASLTAAVLCWLFPPFHIVPLRQAQQAQQQAAFDLSSVARQFWEEQLLPAADRALPVTDLLAALTQEPKAARQRFGYSLGLSTTTCFLVKGSGRVASIDKDGIRIILDGAEPEAAIELVTGPLFGNTIRDATGLLDVNRYPNSQDFNDLSTALNHIVESQVSPPLRAHAAVGKAIRFAGCLELEEGDVPKVLQVIPVKVQ